MSRRRKDGGNDIYEDIQACFETSFSTAENGPYSIEDLLNEFPIETKILAEPIKPTLNFENFAALCDFLEDRTTWNKYKQLLS